MKNTIELPKLILSVLNQSGFRDNYFISDYFLEEIIKKYEQFGFIISPKIIEILAVFGGRDLYFNVDNEDNNRELSFQPSLVLGKVKNKSMLKMQIDFYENILNIKNLIPLCEKISLPITYYIDSNYHIYGIIDSYVYFYKGVSAWNSLEKLFLNDYESLKINTQE